MFSLCCCCLELPSLKGLWSEYSWMGQSEVYGQMLKECFNLTWPKTEQSKEQICEVCITQLRNALQFRQRVVLSQVRLEAKLVDTTKAINDEQLDADNVHTENCIKYQDSDLDDHNEVAGDEIEQNILENDTTLKKKRMLKIEAKPTVKKLDIIEIKPRKLKVIKIQPSKELDKQTEKVKWLMRDPENKLKTKPSQKNRKEIVKRKKAILLISREKQGRRENIEMRDVSYVKPRQNAALIIEHSTIVPFKFNKGYFTCLYCNKQHVGFDELKGHVSESHENMTFKSILKSINRPHDRIKADVSAITCRICKKKIDNLENLLAHLIEMHDIKFIEDDNKKPIDSILAYDLSDGKFKCCICKSEFLFFKTLTTHMNSHSNEYVCDVCGRCFLLPERLRTHIQMHNEVKTVKCDLCDKVYASNFALRSHIRYIHKKNSYMCSLCNVSFNTSKLRTRHLEEVHKRAPLNLTCKICSKKYTSSNSLNSHMRIEHLKIVRKPKHSCSICGTMFKTPNALASHSLVHSGEKNFECEVCHKKYARAYTLTEHLKIHRNDRRWSCGACAQAFVQKCSLRNHIRVHHSNMDSENLIVYKKPDLDSK